MKVLDELFGGPAAFRQQLCRALRDYRRRRRLTYDRLNRLCGFDGEQLPTWQQFEEDANRITPTVVARAATALGVMVDELLDVRRRLGDQAVLRSLRQEMVSRSDDRSQWQKYQGNGQASRPEIAFAIITAFEELEQLNGRAQ